MTRLPPITLPETDYNRLILATAFAERAGSPAADLLAAEVRRAHVCRPSELPDDVVATGCRVSFRLNDNPRSLIRLLVHSEQLAWPGAEISVTSCLGAALVGLREGDRMPFHDENGVPQSVQVDKIWLRIPDDGLIWRRPNQGLSI